MHHLSIEQKITKHIQNQYMPVLKDKLIEIKKHKGI
jgi:hypothetical protein